MSTLQSRQPPMATNTVTSRIVDLTNGTWGQPGLFHAQVGEIVFYPNGYEDRMQGQVLRYIHNRVYQGRQFRIEHINQEIIFPNTIPHCWNKQTLVLRRVV
jgi:hypothetical protein